MSCKGCVHFQLGGGNPSTAKPSRDMFDDGGVCRRSPPIWLPARDLGDGPEGSWAFPGVHQDQSCGEFDSAIPL